MFNSSFWMYGWILKDFWEKSKSGHYYFFFDLDTVINNLMRWDSSKWENLKGLPNRDFWMNWPLHQPNMIQSSRNCVEYVSGICGKVEGV